MKKTKSDVVPESQFRTRLLNLAKNAGCEDDLKKIFNRYDNLLRNCTNPQERKAISIMGIAEIHRFFGCTDALVVAGQEILPALNDNLKTPNNNILV